MTIWTAITLGGLGEFLKVRQTLDFASGLHRIVSSYVLHNCLEFSKPSLCLDDE